MDSLLFLLLRTCCGRPEGSVLFLLEKCHKFVFRYGCHLYKKDAFHAPCAPDPESTKKVLKEYNKAILMNGPDGKKLSEDAIKLEVAAYHKGYYKAFAFVSISSSPGSDCCSSETGTQNKEQSCQGKENKVRPLMEACGIDVFGTARKNGFKIDTKKDTYGRWNYFALVLIE